MKCNSSILFFVLLLFFSTGCKTAKPDVKHPGKNGKLIISMERTPCYGRCPIYKIEIFENGLLFYNTKQFTDTVACRYRLLSKQQVNDLKNKFEQAKFFELADNYPTHVTDVPSCILFFNNGTQQKTITDQRFHSPETLTELEKTVDILIDTKILQFCDN